MSLYYGVKARMRVGSGLSEELWVLVCVCQESTLSPLLFAISVDVITQYAKEGLINKFFYR